VLTVEAEAAQRLIRERLAGGTLPAHLEREAAGRIDPKLLAAWFKMPLRPAAVLVPLVTRKAELHMLLTERTHTVRDHPGQVAFPGGTVEPEDADLVCTALRESNEEIGMRRDQVEVIGYLPPQAVITGYAVLPVVGFFAPDFEPIIDRREVAGVFEVPLAYLQDFSNLIRIDRERNGVVLPTYEYHYDNHRIWGATALMIRQFVEALA
jgi:8-oxo-dGTP pyrophosphatase MutT (NUDIX family)